uniref:Uncharacterized protein n=1 Tax=Periophthalmus magnuspinnatus TaxID=409849 RepID=A0A3B4BG97_9GOBI
MFWLMGETGVPGGNPSRHGEKHEKLHTERPGDPGIEPTFLCSASPQPVPHHDKENQQEALCCGERMDYQDYSKLFLDEDSNQILPVEHFFGNMDAVQDFPQRPSAPSTTVSRAQRRRRYFALEDSEEEEEEEEGEVTKRREEGEREEPEQPEQHPEESPSDRH